MPAIGIAIRAWRGTLGANPVAEALNELGLLALVFLVASLAMTPLRLRLKWNWALRVRRMLGLFAFFYATAHFTTYAVVDQGVDVGAIVADIGTRKFIFVGFAAWLLLVPLAVTSTDRMVRRLGFARWKRLHRFAYVAGALGVVHFYWRVKRDTTEPWIFGILLGAFFVVRIVEAARKRAAKRVRAA